MAPSTGLQHTARRIGYGLTIAINAVMLVIVSNVREWDWFPWLTAELENVVWIISLSLIAAIAVNALYLVYDPPGFKRAAELVLLTISLMVMIRLLQVFPFDFSAYSFGWGTLTRWILWVVVFAIGLSIVVQVVQLLRIGIDPADQDRTQTVQGVSHTRRDSNPPPSDQ